MPPRHDGDHRPPPEHVCVVDVPTRAHGHVDGDAAKARVVQAIWPAIGSSPRRRPVEVAKQKLVLGPNLCSGARLITFSQRAASPVIRRAATSGSCSSRSQQLSHAMATKAVTSSGWVQNQSFTTPAMHDGRWLIQLTAKHASYRLVARRCAVAPTRTPSRPPRRSVSAPRRLPSARGRTRDAAPGRRAPRASRRHGANQSPASASPCNSQSVE